MLQPEVYRDHALVWVVGVTLYFASLLVGIVKFHRFANLHLQSKRYGSVLMCLFVASTFIIGQPNAILFYLAMAMFIVSSAEGLLLQLLCSHVDEHMASLLFVLRRRLPS